MLEAFPQVVPLLYEESVEPLGALLEAKKRKSGVPQSYSAPQLVYQQVDLLGISGRLYPLLVLPGKCIAFYLRFFLP